MSSAFHQLFSLLIVTGHRVVIIYLYESESRDEHKCENRTDFALSGRQLGAKHKAVDPKDDVMSASVEQS